MNYIIFKAYVSITIKVNQQLKEIKDMKHDQSLTETGIEIFNRLIEHCETIGLLDIDSFELSMMANSFDTYFKYAKICNETGATQKPKEGGWDQVRPEYTIMKNEYQNILKHSSKFGLNPGDRAKIFNMKKKDTEKKKGFKLD
jgi:phage terminase small subunit